MVTQINNELKTAISEVAKVIRATMGPGGRKVLLKDGTFSRDGITVLRGLHFDDPWKDVAVKLLIDASDKVVRVAGDGTSSTVLMVDSLLNGVIPTSQEVENIIESLGAGRRRVKNIDVLRKVALVAANARQDLADLIAELVWELGGDGFVRSQGYYGRTWTEIKKGYTMDVGAYSPVFLRYRGGANTGIVNNGDGSLQIYNPVVALVEMKLTEQKEVLKIYQEWKKLTNYERPLVLIVGDLEGPAYRFVKKNMEAGANAIPIASPETGRRRYDVLTDLQACLDTPKVVSEFSGFKIADFGAQDFGSASLIDVREKECRIEFENDVTQRIDELRAELDKVKTQLGDTQWLAERISKLHGKIGVIHIGGNTESEHEYLRQVIEDGVRACQGAMKEGVYPGAGWAYGKAGVTDITESVTGMEWKTGETYEIVGERIHRVGIEDTKVLDSAQAVHEVIRVAASLAREIRDTRYIVQ